MSSKKRIEIADHTKKFAIAHIGQSYFHTNFSTLDEKLEAVREITQDLTKPDLYGTFKDNQHYLSSVNALIASTYETEHRNEILFQEVIPKMKIRNNFLDVGVGNGDLTKFFGQYFSKITIVDTQKGALGNVPDNFGTRNQKVTKIEGSILSEETSVFQEKYDLILLSHVLYYIPTDQRLNLLNKLYNQLNEDGSMIVIYNTGGSRYALGAHFSKEKFDHEYTSFQSLSSSFENIFYKVEVFESKEILTTDNIGDMMHIAGVSLNDASVNATEPELYNYLEKHHHYEELYQIDMFQNIVVIGACNDC